MAQDTPPIEDFLAEIVRAFRGVSSFKAARSYLHVATNLGFLDLSGGRVRLTPQGQRLRRSRSRKLIAKALTDRIAGVPEILRALEAEPRRIGLLLRLLQDEGFDTWATDKQVRYRLRWLEEAGVVERHGRARPVYRIAKGQGRWAAG